MATADRARLRAELHAEAEDSWQGAPAGEGVGRLARWAIERIEVGAGVDLDDHERLAITWLAKWLDDGDYLSAVIALIIADRSGPAGA